MKLRSLLILLLCVLVLVQTADGKKRKRKKPKVKPTTRAPTTTTTRAPTLQTDPSTSYTPQVAGACRRTCERNSYLMPDRCVCVCNQGYEYSSRTGYCEDIDECADESNCVGGACTNSRGSYYCICPVGYNLHANGKLCLLEPRVMSCRGLVCFDGAELDELRCRCWCSDPGLTYDYFEEKCQDINECVAGSHNCEHGCINTEGSFMCYCVSGFQLDADGTTCLPSPPPDPSTIPCFGKCPGATALNLLNCNCMCETGFVYGEDELECVDRDECRDYQGWCQGVCENTPGSYTCTCPTGTVLDADGWTCNEPVSSSGEFECFDYEILCDHGNQCVQEGVICDGYSDCSDGSDERQCKPVCRPDQFSCANGRACLEATQRCNGENDCLDFSDELDCPCKDEKDECHAWRNRGECESNPGWMNWNCRESCKTCMKDDGTESGVVEESELPMLFFLRNSEDFASTLQYTLRNTGNREGASGSEWLCHTVTEVPIAVRAQFRLSYAYRKYAQAYNIPILGTARANEDAMTRACYVVRFLLADRRDLREALYRAWGRIAVMDDDEVTVNIPEHSHLPELYNSLRGLGGTLHIPVASGATENLICLENDPNSGQDMFVHTMAHTIRRVSITTMTSTYNSRLLGAYVNARKTDLWANTRAQYTADEYFAQGVMSFFNVITDSEIDSREKLQRYDPALYNLVKEVFPCMNTIVDRCDADQSKIYTEQIRMNCNERGEPDRQLDPDTMAEDVCRNLHHECPQWKNDGGCQNNAVWMSTHCPKSCGTCPEPEEEPVDGPSIELGRDDEGNIKFKEPSDCQDADDQCLQWVQEGRCETHAGWMEIFCEKSCSMCEDQEEIVLRDNDSDNEEQTPLPPDEAQCVDSHFLCEINAKAGECTTNEFWMRKHCPLSCHFCIDISVSHFTCQDSDPVCHELAKEGNCEVEWIKANCKKSCGTCPATEEKTTTSAPTPVPVDEYTCVDIDPICTEWADEGECMNNPRYMEENCPVSCSYCSNSETKEEQSQYEFIPTPANEPESVCADLEPHCIGWAESGECVYSPEYMQVNCPASCGFCKGPGVKPVKPNCVDHDRYCPDWASEGDCATNPEWMLVNCKLSCGICDDPLIPADSDCFDTDQYCVDWAESGNCETDRHWMFVNCPQSCGLCDGSQIPPKPTISTQTSSYHYEPNCKDSDALCPGWAFYGGCYQNPEWMLPNCAYSCNSCHYIVTNDTQVDPEPSEQPLSCSDKYARCQDLATTGGCLTIPEWMTEHCPVSCNMCGDREIVTHLPPPAKTNYPTDDENMAVTSTASLGEVEESENSDASEWTGDWIHTSDSWRESQITQVWEDSQSDDSSDDNSDLTAEASMIDIPEEGFSINTGVFTNEDVTQSPVSVSKSQDSITVPGSVLSTKITEKMSTSRDESAQPPNSVTPSFHSFTSLSSSLTDSLGEVPPTVFHEDRKNHRARVESTPKNTQVHH
ncbi:uncharacterized protein LOC110981859 isoform X2 [Acanthaster planci]|uniref:Uncharacterized protein LOC110981859 isoform X2 n=1 Tax=Acanthaster planci TaxID=133434 RepID=A0A8B7YS79_ACAPL|nr:uncharacterized protein LOC110981859 isoform X2 [Acanthaster planci]